jgi:hypothetical protein
VDEILPSRGVTDDSIAGRVSSRYCDIPLRRRRTSPHSPWRALFLSVLLVDGTIQIMTSLVATALHNDVQA